MMTRRDALKTAAAGVALTVLGTENALAAKSALTWQHFPAGEHGFFRAPVLISGSKEALLIDGGFTFPDGQAVAAAIKASGKKLTTVYISHSDPDYYFSLKPIREAFPAARILAAPATIAAIEATVQKKLAVWGPQLKENGPQSMADIVMPEAFDGTTLKVDGQNVEIINADGFAGRRTLWVPSIKALFGGVMVFSGTHVWTADTATPALRAAWVHSLDALLARHPAIVIAGHLKPGAATDVAAIKYTRDYLLAFETELGKAANSAELIAAMSKRYPDSGMEIALQIGAKVAKGEMAWG